MTQLFDLNARIQQLTWSLIFYEKYSTRLSTIVLVVLTTANCGGFSNFYRYYTRSQAGKSTGYRPTLKPLSIYIHSECFAAILVIGVRLFTQEDPRIPPKTYYNVIFRIYLRKCVLNIFCLVKIDVLSTGVHSVIFLIFIKIKYFPF